MFTIRERNPVFRNNSAAVWIAGEEDFITEAMLEASIDDWLNDIKDLENETTLSQTFVRKLFYLYHLIG